jgi:two-component system sensor histidine kinase DesK
MAFAALWLIYLSYPWSVAWSSPPGAARTVSLVSVILFSAVYLVAIVRVRLWRRSGARGRGMPHGWVYIAGEGLGVAGMSLASHETSFAGLVFMAVSAVFALARPEAFAVVAVLVVAGETVPHVVPGWRPVDNIGVQIVLAALAVWGFTQVMRRNIELARARLEVADLAVARERERMARDVHDLLGHSLTVITVKSELAGRLLEIDPRGAAREIADIEGLARAALADVRATLHGFRAVGLVSELASARAALEAAGIDAQLPSAVDAVPDGLRELFAWSVREATTNVVRHSGARRCEIVLSGRTLVVRDDGRGPGGPDDADSSDGAMRTDGSGLTGLRERAAAAGATVSVGSSPLGGFELRVEGAA